MTADHEGPLAKNWFLQHQVKFSKTTKSLSPISLDWGKKKKEILKPIFFFTLLFGKHGLWHLTDYILLPHLKSSQEMRTSQWAANSGQWYKTILQKTKVVSCISFTLSVKPKIISKIKMLHKYTKYPGGAHLLYWPESVFSLAVNLWKVVRSVVSVRRCQICHWNLAFEYYNIMETCTTLIWMRAE